ncbi:hypothetical protein J3R83DRAFT_56 [Lanmaoa asiatica]|nr:hypothetical protein J3R83DRAFT_56 [Lanmaoa asiatica]
MLNQSKSTDFRSRQGANRIRITSCRVRSALFDNSVLSFRTHAYTIQPATNITCPYDHFGLQLHVWTSLRLRSASISDILSR